MCNCGNKRSALRRTPSRLSEPVVAGHINKPLWPDVLFEYLGKTAMTITGYITGKRYRFEAHGQVQLIDYRDAPGMLSVPLLKRRNNR